MCVHYSMQYWQLNVSEGNAAFASNQFARAALHYQAGLHELLSIERFIHCDSPPPKAWIIDQYLPALIVSYLNLCDSKLAQNKIESACELLEIGYQTALNFATSCVQKSDFQLQNSALRHLSKLKKYAFILAKQLADKPSSLLKLNTIINTHTIINHNIH